MQQLFDYFSFSQKVSQTIFYYSKELKREFTYFWFLVEHWVFNQTQYAISDIYGGLSIE